MRIKSKYSEEKIDFKETGRDYDFIATVENLTDKELRLLVDDLEGWYSEPLVIAPRGWIGLLADDEGRGIAESIKCGDFIVRFKEVV